MTGWPRSTAHGSRSSPAPGAPPAKEVAQLRAAFVCSAPYSGSTLLDLLLGSHPSAVALGEITQLPKNLALNTRCTCGETARTCPVWTAIVRQLAAEAQFRLIERDPYVLHLGFIKAGRVIDRHEQTPLRELYRKAVYGLCYSHLRWRLPAPRAALKLLEEGARNKLLLFRTVATVLGRPVLVDSSKHYLEAVSLHAAAPDTVRVVLLFRDGRAVFFSGLKRGAARGVALDAWRKTYERALPLLASQVRSEHLLHVKYEDLAAEPERELRRLCAFLGIDFAPEMLEFREREHHVLNGNDMRFARESRIRPDLSWRDGLSREDLAYFERKAGKLNRALGYR